jgi:hypothetical protein
MNARGLGCSLFKRHRPKWKLVIIVGDHHIVARATMLPFTWLNDSKDQHFVSTSAIAQGYSYNMRRARI